MSLLEKTTVMPETSYVVYKTLYELSIIICNKNVTSDKKKLFDV